MAGLIWFHLMPLSGYAKTPLASVPYMHVVVALTDNEYQGIVPVPRHLGDGDQPAGNLYWGAAYGMKTFFSKKVPDWEKIKCETGVSQTILERCWFKTKQSPHAIIQADAYRGREIAQAMMDFMTLAAGQRPSTWAANQPTQIPDMVVYVGHNGLMDAPLQWVRKHFPEKSDKGKSAAVLACKSRQYFSALLTQAGTKPMVMTDTFMAPEAYIVHAIAEGFRRHESASQMQNRAAGAYAKYQKISVKSAGSVFGVGR